MALKKLGRFLIIRPLGSGSFATVWLAQDPDLEAEVAIKVLADNWSQNDDARRRFQQEARALRSLDSDRIVRVYDVGVLPDDRPYMVMEFADLGTLEDRMRERFEAGRMYTIGEAVAISLELADCLADAHDRGIVHRDLKPSNVMFRSVPKERLERMRREGRPVWHERMLLGDFGIARKLETVLGPTVVVGSPHYMAPEQSDLATTTAVDQRADIYSAAVLLYELLAGKVPFPYDSITQVLRAQLEAGPPPVWDVRSDVPSRLASVLHQGLASDPDWRFPTAGAWREALLAAFDSAPV
jgi:eukaryotic-like serine/threonine-protein kinase